MSSGKQGANFSKEDVYLYKCIEDDFTKVLFAYHKFINDNSIYKKSHFWNSVTDSAIKTVIFVNANEDNKIVSNDFKMISKSKKDEQHALLNMNLGGTFSMRTKSSGRYKSFRILGQCDPICTN